MYNYYVFHFWILERKSNAGALVGNSGGPRADTMVVKNIMLYSFKENNIILIHIRTVTVYIILTLRSRDTMKHKNNFVIAQTLPWLSFFFFMFVCNKQKVLLHKSLLNVFVFHWNSRKNDTIIGITWYILKYIYVCTQ